MKKDYNKYSLSRDARVSFKLDEKSDEINEIWLRVDGLYPKLVHNYIYRIKSAYPKAIEPDPRIHKKSYHNYYDYLYIMSLFLSGKNSEQVADILTDSETKAGRDITYTGEQVRKIKERLLKKFEPPIK